MHARRQHLNAPLTPEGRRRMVACVLDRGWTIEQTAERFQVDAKTVRKWRDRFRAEGVEGLQDRSSRPHRSPNRTPGADRRRVLMLAGSAVGARTILRSRSGWRPRRCNRSCERPDVHDSIVGIGRPIRHRCSVMSGTGPESSSMSM